jgi:2-methylcitrate dehydratase PrpD
MILTPQQMAESMLKMLEDAVADIYPPEEREEAKARILDAWSAEMFQARRPND